MSYAKGHCPATFTASDSFLQRLRKRQWWMGLDKKVVTCYILVTIRLSQHRLWRPLFPTLHALILDHSTVNASPIGHWVSPVGKAVPHYVYTLQQWGNRAHEQRTSRFLHSWRELIQVFVVDANLNFQHLADWLFQNSFSPPPNFVWHRWKSNLFKQQQSFICLFFENLKLVKSTHEDP